MIDWCLTPTLTVFQLYCAIWWYIVFCLMFCRSLFVPFLLVIVLSVFWPLYCLSFGHCIDCLLVIVLSVFWPLYCVFWPLYCLSFGHCIVCPFGHCIVCLFGHCIVCLLAIVLTVLRFATSDYLFGIFKLFLCSDAIKMIINTAQK